MQQCVANQAKVLILVSKKEIAISTVWMLSFFLAISEDSAVSLRQAMLVHNTFCAGSSVPVKWLSRSSKRKAEDKP